MDACAVRRSQERTAQTEGKGNAASAAGGV